MKDEKSSTPFTDPSGETFAPPNIGSRNRGSGSSVKIVQKVVPNLSFPVIYHPTDPTIVATLLQYGLHPEQLTLIWDPIHKSPYNGNSVWIDDDTDVPTFVRIDLYLYNCQSWIQARVTFMHELAHTISPPYPAGQNGRWAHHHTGWKTAYCNVLRNEGPILLPPEYHFVIEKECRKITRTSKSRERYGVEEGAGPNGDFGFGGGKLYA